MSSKLCSALCRKPISIVKNSRAFLDCGPGNHTTNTTCTSWISQIDGKSEEEAKTFLGLLDTSYLFSYAFFMFWSGFVAERMDLRYFRWSQLWCSKMLSTSGTTLPWA